MSNRQRSELESQGTQGVSNAQARILLERVESGTLDPQMLKLANYCRDPIAQLVCDEAPPAFSLPDDLNNLELWFINLLPWGKPALVRAALAAGQLALRHCREQGLQVLPQQDASITVIINWLDCPCSIHAMIAKDVAGAFEILPSIAVGRKTVLGSAILTVAEAAAWAGREETAILGKHPDLMPGVMRSATKCIGNAQQVHQTACSALISWALAGESEVCRESIGKSSP